MEGACDVLEATAQGQIGELFEKMAPRRRVLAGILELCAQPQTDEGICGHVDQLQASNRSVFTAANLVSLLAGAGALERVDRQGQPYPEGCIEPVRVTVDGVGYYRAAEPPVAYWRTTPAGRAALDDQQSGRRLHALFEEDRVYLPVYKTVLALYAAEGGAAAAALSDAVDGAELVQSPRLYAQYFLERLEAAGALEWADRAWRATDQGRAALEGGLDEVDGLAAAGSR